MINNNSNFNKLWFCIACILGGVAYLSIIIGVIVGFSGIDNFDFEPYGVCAGIVFILDIIFNLIMLIIKLVNRKRY